MKIIIKETIWIISCIALLCIFQFIFLGNNGLKLNFKHDINFRDMYFLIENINLIILNGSIIFFSVYLVRTINNKLRNHLVNIIYILSNAILILISLLFNMTLHSANLIFIGRFWSIIKILAILISIILTFSLILIVYKAYIQKKKITLRKNLSKQPRHLSNKVAKSIRHKK